MTRKVRPQTDSALLFQPRRERISQVVFRDKKLSMIIDGREEKPYDSIVFMQYSPNSKRLPTMPQRKRVGHGG